jgi:hypothetical protein
MPSLSATTRQEDGVSAESKGSSAPLLSKSAQEPADSAEVGDSSKPRKRDFFKFGKGKDDDKDTQKNKAPVTSSSFPDPPQIPPIGGLRPASPMRSGELLAGATSPHRYPGSPSHAAQGSPRPHSPASSMIFERNVQEDVAHPEASPAIPSHVITENHIPPALDASAEAITQKLDPDTVEIITHATHQPAAVTITGAPAASIEHSLASSMHGDEQLSSPAIQRERHDTDTGSNYGSLDSSDVRRLSFISFADVVHGEQEHGSVSGERRDSALLSNSALAAPRSPSPIRSLVSSAAFGTSPPTSVSTSGKGLETSPHRGAGSPPLSGGTASPLSGELNIETMTQALRRTGSGDLSGVRSAPVSAVEAPSETGFERGFR